MAQAPIFAASPKSWHVWTVPTAGGTTQTATITAAGLQATGNARSGSNANLPTGAVLLLSGGTSGSKVDEITFTAIATSTSNVGRIFINNGTNVYLYKEVSIPAVTASASVPAASVTISFNNLLIPSGSSIYVSVATLDSGYAVSAFGGDF
jgi:hypothetical protein